MYNGAEAAVSIWAGVAAGSVALTGFGLDSIIEMTSGAALLWRFRGGSERIALRIVGWCFAALAVYIAVASGRSILQREQPERSIPGVAIAVVSVTVMPLLARAKRRAAAELRSGALHADSRQTDFCGYLSAILLAGLLLNWLAGWWWADPAAGLLMVPIIGKEAFGALRGEHCTCGE